jgi:predicted amidophosphoribosyltransferase
MEQSIIPKGFESTAHPIFKNYHPPQILNETTHEVTPFLEDKKCPICLSTRLDPVTLINCAHTFCSKCIRKWFRIKLSCPLCKSPAVYFIKCPEVRPKARIWTVYSIVGVSKKEKRRLKFTNAQLQSAIRAHKIAINLGS